MVSTSCPSAEPRSFTTTSSIRLPPTPISPWLPCRSPWHGCARKGSVLPSSTTCAIGRASSRRTEALRLEGLRLWVLTGTCGNMDTHRHPETRQYGNMDTHWGIWTRREYGHALPPVIWTRTAIVPMRPCDGSQSCCLECAQQTRDRAPFVQPISSGARPANSARQASGCSFQVQVAVATVLPEARAGLYPL